MAGSTRYELAAGSPESSAFPSAYPNGQRGSYSSAILDRSGSFRDGVETRILNSGPGSSRGSTPSPMDILPSQFLNLEQFITPDQKFTRSGELRRVLGVSLASTSEDRTFGASHSKLSPPIAAEELKRFKASVLDTSNKARDRSQKLTDSFGKLEKYRQVLLSRKRRSESSERSGVTGILKMGNQIHQSPSDVTQRLEDRNKNVVLNKRVRTSLAESEGRNTAILRQPVVLDKDRDMLRPCSGASLPVEEKIRGLPASGEGWDKKMKRKRSAGTVATRAMDGERELKRPMSQKLSNDPRPRLYDANGLGSGPTNGVTGMNKVDSASQVNTSNGRLITRNEVESASFSNDRRERGTGMDKERVLPKGNKISSREDIQAGSPSPVTKGKVSRGPRTGSVAANSSPSFSRTPPALDVWEQPSCLNKVQPAGGTNNRKRSIPTGSSSPPMAQWVGQRQQKSSRTRRANLVSPVSNHDEAHIPPEAFPAPDFSGRLTANEVNGSILPRGVSPSSQHPKMKFENVPSPARLSESEESGAGENKLKEKGVDNDEIEDRSINTSQKVGSVMMPTKKNRLHKEEIGDGVRRQGRSGRGSSMARACIPHAREKLENSVTAKPMQSVKPGSDKNESKTGRPPSKKSAERKGFGRPGNALNSGSSDMTGESDDDHEELLAAASSVHSAQHLACSGSFWKKMEPIFGCISPEDTAHLKRQLSFAEELDESLHHMFGADFSIMDELVHNEVVSSPSIISKNRQGVYMNGIGSNGSAEILGLEDHFHDGTLSAKSNRERTSAEVTPLYQRVLSALIGEEEAEELDCDSEQTQAHFQYSEDQRLDSEVDSEIDFRIQKQCVFDSFSCDGSTASNSFKSSSVHNPLYSDSWPGEDRMVNSEVGLASEFVNHQSQPMDTSISDTPYEQMSLDDRLLLELQSIGLYPEAVPDLSEGEEEEVSRDILALKEGLYKQVGKKKGHLCKLEKVIQEGRKVEERILEESAMDKLVEMAYKKRMACRGSNAAKSGVSRGSKQAALSFVKRTIARCRKFEETGKSCFSEPSLRDIIFTSRNIDVKHDVTGANTCMETHNNQPESRASAVGATSTSTLDAFQTDQDFTKQESIPNRGKKKEVLLDEVARAPPALGGGAKGRRSERDRDQNKFTSTRNSAAKAGRPAVGGFRGERKNKTKPKQKTAQLSTSGNGLLSRVTETTTTDTNPVYSPLDSSNKQNVLLPEDSLKERDKPLDLIKMPLHDIDSIEELGVSGGQSDFWWNLDEDVDVDVGFADHDSVGLEIPMDDLADVMM